MNITDIEILALIQENADLTNEEIAKQVNLSAAPCWRRVQKLKQAGVIQKNVALLDRERLNLGIMAFMNVRAHLEAEQELTELRAKIKEIPEILGFFRSSGDTDYIIWVVTADMPSYNSIYKRIISFPGIYEIKTNFVMEELKLTSSLPLNYVDV